MSLHQLIEDYKIKLAEATRSNPRKEPFAVIQAYRSEVTKIKPSTEEVEEELRRLYPTCDVGQSPFVMIAAWANPSKAYTSILTQMLSEPRWSGAHEVVVDLLTALKDPYSLEALIRAIDYRWDFDPDLQIPIKALQAIAELNTPSSKVVLEAVAQSNPDAAIRAEAATLLRVGHESST